MIDSKGINDQRILQYDWMRDTTRHKQLKVVVSDVKSTWWLTPCKKLKYHLIFCRNIDDQRILQSDWTRNTSGHAHLKVVVSEAISTWWLTPCKKLKYHLIFVGILSPHKKILGYRLNLSRDIDDQRILQYDLLRTC